MTDRLNILIIGGYGIFGGRIVELLEDEPRLNLTVAGRSLEKASAFCQSRHKARAQLVPAAFDRNGDLAAQIAARRPELLVDASGPFQAYGNDRYRVIEACIAQRVNYLDLADGSDFVAGVGGFDAAARAAGCYVLSGVSSFPVLTAAVVRHLSSDMARVDTIHGGIAPSPFAGVGENVIRAIAGYAGQPVVLKRDGKTAKGYPFTEQLHFTVAPPGRLPLRDTMFSLVDVPDLRALQELWPDATTIWMGAGPVPEILHRALVALAWLVRCRLIPALSGLAPLMHWATNHLRWGEHRGGMFVAVQGTDYQRLFASRTIYTGVRDDRPITATPLYARLLGTAWNELPDAIRNLHDLDHAASARGRASVERGGGLLARLAAFIIGFPKAVADTPVSVEFVASDGTETWTRKFGDQVFSSRQSAGTGKSAGLLCERFGPLTFAMALVLENNRLTLRLRRWSAFGIALPMWLCPRSDSYETTDDGQFHFHVRIWHPLTGLIVQYKGWLEPDRQEAAS
jgi:hypothetical protein